MFEMKRRRRMKMGKLVDSNLGGGRNDSEEDERIVVVV